MSLDKVDTAGRYLSGRQLEPVSPYHARGEALQAHVLHHVQFTGVGLEDGEG